MINVGVIGLGMMGQTHLDIYGKRADVRIAALADADEDRLHGRTRAAGNIDGQAEGVADTSGAKKYTSAEALIDDPDVELIDICLPTPLHRPIGELALASGRHVMIEKPLARTAADAAALADAAGSAKGIAMPGMCMRFWPGWSWLKAVIDDQRFGPLLSLHLTRLTSFPPAPFYADGAASGGAILDLHVHDTDFVNWCLGMPEAVTAVGHAGISREIDYVSTQYHYADGPTVSAVGGWSLAEGYGFEMRFVANFEQATASFDIAREPALRVVAADGSSIDVDTPAGMGYEHEIAYLLDCIENSRTPEVVTLRDAAESIRLVEAEAQSVASRGVVTL